MGEIVNVVVAFAVIVFLFRWATQGGANDESRRARDVLGFQPKNVTPEMISTVQSMFPDIPRDNIQYDLLRTGNVQTTSNKLLERGFLEAPPPGYYQLFPSQQPVAPTALSTAQNSATASSSNPSKSNLIFRYNLQDRLRSGAEASATELDAGGKATWEDTAERREASLKERKAKMVLAARKRFLEQQQQTDSG